jgi:hypothetical protein
MSRTALRALGIPIALLAIVLLGSCDPGRALVIRNETATDVIFVAASEPNRELRFVSGQERRLGVLEGHSTGTFRLARPNGEILYDGDLTWAELEQMDFLLVINLAGVQRGRVPATRTP